MNKEEALEELFRNLKITFNISSLYEKEHPFFIKSVKEFKTTVDKVFDFLESVRIGVTANSLVVEDKAFAGSNLYEDLANIFHLRRVKCIKIEKGVTVEELTVFLNKFSAPKRDIYRDGGIASILKKENLKHVSVEELDYYQLLKGQGTEYKDIWTYLLKDAVVESDKEKINELVNNFDKLAGNFTVEGFLKNSEERENINKFLEYLKASDKDRYAKCTKRIINSILNDKNISTSENLEKLKVFTRDLSEIELAGIFSDEVLNNEGFDSLSFNLFSILTDGKNNEEISSLAANRLKRVPANILQKAKSKIDDLFSKANPDANLKIYHQALAAVFKGSSLDIKLTLDRENLKTNYRFILLNLLYLETEKEKINTILAGISKIFEEQIARDNDLEYLKLLAGILNEKKRNSPDLADSFSPIEKLISDFVENIILDDNNPLDIKYFMDIFQLSARDFDSYINKIFNENKVNSNLLTLFFKFFPEQSDIFFENLEKKRLDLEFLENMIKSLEAVNSPPSIEAIKCIFLFSNKIIKIVALKAMQRLTVPDKNFLLPVLKEQDLYLRKEIMATLAAGDSSTKKEAFKALFSISSPLGMKNNLIIENLKIVQSLGLKGAIDYVDSLSKRKFFWNSNIRQAAREIIEGWRGRKD